MQQTAGAWCPKLQSKWTTSAVNHYPTFVSVTLKNCRDELPLYLFDKHCLGWTQAGCSHSLAHDYQV
jgi:hypothetical protein